MQDGEHLHLLAHDAVGDDERTARGSADHLWCKSASGARADRRGRPRAVARRSWLTWPPRLLVEARMTRALRASGGRHGGHVRQRSRHAGCAGARRWRPRRRQRDQDRDSDSAINARQSPRSSDASQRRKREGSAAIVPSPASLHVGAEGAARERLPARRSLCRGLGLEPGNHVRV